jgi:hypothetical protein
MGNSPPPHIYKTYLERSFLVSMGATLLATYAALHHPTTTHVSTSYKLYTRRKCVCVCVCCVVCVTMEVRLISCFLHYLVGGRGGGETASCVGHIDAKVLKRGGRGAGGGETGSQRWGGGETGSQRGGGVNG